MRVGIVGCGVVGNVLVQYLRKTHERIEIRISDLLKDRDDPLYDCDAIFISVPVPTLQWSGVQDLQAIEQALAKIKNPSIPIFIRSTVLPGTCDALAKKYELRVYAMPEFLTERIAQFDFERHSLVVGGREDISYEHMQLMIALFPGKTINWVRNREAEITKYAHNCFAAVKVNYWNTIAQLCDRTKSDYSNVRKLSSEITGFFTATHMLVPGPDGHPGFGGKCLPKDLKAFIAYLDGLNLPHQSLAATEDENITIRGDQP